MKKLEDLEPAECLIIQNRIYPMTGEGTGGQGGAPESLESLANASKEPSDSEGEFELQT